MKKSRLPTTDSVQELAAFWESHDVTDFADELEEVKDPVFVRGSGIKVPLESREIKSVERMAKAQGVSREALVRSWVLKNIKRRNGNPSRT